MSLPARAENVAVVRHAVAGLGERLGMDEASVADLKTVVTEAAMNVVVHAYPEGVEGPLEVEAAAEGEGITVEVRDQGSGIRPRPDVGRSSLRLGLTLIAALCSSFEISGGSGRGTAIRMYLPLHGAEPEPGAEPDATPAPAPEVTEVRIGSPELVGAVLSRVLGALAARQEVSVDRLSDAMLLSDAIAAEAPGVFADGEVVLSLADRDGAVVLRVGPMIEGGAERLRESLELPELGSLATLADGLRVEGKNLVVEFAALTR
jgi:serine/threonine-protein kinase RsbW